MASSDEKPLGSSGSFEGVPVLGYWKIRGLAAASRMMFHYAGQTYIDRGYGEDAREKYFGGDKPELAKKNPLVNLPYVIDGDHVVTQSNSVLIYLGKKLGIDKEDYYIHNHQALDQAMDLRNDMMKVVYPFSGAVKTKEEFPAALASHMGTCAATHLAKLEGFCVGPFMCGAEPQASDFHVFEILDQHVGMTTETNTPFDLGAYPKLKALHARMKAEPKLANYFAADCYASYAVNNPAYTFFTGKGYSGAFGPTVETHREMTAASAKGKKSGKGGDAAMAAKMAGMTKEEKERAKFLAKVVKEGGKKGVEIEGAADMGGLEFFCTTIESPDGDVELLQMAMTAMNAPPDSDNSEERKGCSGRVGKMIFSAGVKQLAIVAYVPAANAEKVPIAEWIAHVAKDVGGEVTMEPTPADSPDGGMVAAAVVKADADAGKFPLKDKDLAMASAFAFLRSKDAFPEDKEEDDDEVCFGDDAFDGIDDL